MMAQLFGVGPSGESVPIKTDATGVVQVAGVTGGAVGGAPVNRSGSITSGCVAQSLMAASPTRFGFVLQNLSAGDLWVNVLGGAAAAAAPSFKIESGAYFETPPNYRPTAAVSIFGATTGQSFTAQEY
jgi:hypothetical protein